MFLSCANVVRVYLTKVEDMWNMISQFLTKSLLNCNNVVCFGFKCVWLVPHDYQ